MRQRTTFVHGPDDPFDPSQLQLQNNSLYLTSLKAAREDRLTLSLYELPQELWRTLKQCHQLHIKWVSSSPYTVVAPFLSTAAPGLHVFFTPKKNRTADLLCPLLHKTFGAGVDCRAPEVTFTRLSISSERFASSAALQYYETLPSLTDFTTYLLEKICPGLHETCKHKADALRSADYIDIDYDAISQSLVLSAFWNIPPLSGVWNEQVDTIEGSVQVEVGVLANEKPTQPEELSLGGFLAVIGEDSKTKPTLFSFPSRHHLVPPGFGANYSTAFLKPTGLHPTLRLTLPSSINPPLPTCALHTYLNLPSALFLDKYQLSSPNYLTSKNLKSIRALSGETDLEAPIWTVVQWGSAVLLELAHPPSDSESASILDSSRPGSPWHADIPLHLRYLRANPGGQIPLSIAWPVVFWACPSDYGTKMNTNPFDRVNLGYDGLFGPRTMFYHLQAASGGKPLTEELQAPVLDLEGSKLKWVELGTVTIVILGSLWVCSKLLRVTMMMSSGGQKEDRQRKKQ